MSVTQEAVTASNNLIAEVEKLESRRRTSNVMVIFTTASFLSIFYSLNFLPATEHWEAGPDLTFWTILVFGFIAVILGVWRAGIVKRYKSIFMPIVLNELVGDYNYEPKNYLDVALFNEAGLFSSPDRYNGSDLVSVVIGKTDMVFSFVHAERETTSTDSNGKTSTSHSTIFLGLLLISEFNKRTENKTEIWPVPFDEAKGTPLKMDSVAFNKQFSVYTSDRTEAFYLLTPGYMERLLRVRQKLGKIYISIHDSKLYMAVDLDSNLGISLWRSLTDASQIMKLKYNLKMILDIPNDLNLNTRIWGIRD